MKPRISLSNTAIRAEVDGMPEADIAAGVPDTAAPQAADAVSEAVGAATSPAAPATVDTAANIITPNQFAPPVAPKIIDPDAPMPLPVAPLTDLDTIALVAGQENYGLAIVLLGEAIWSFSKAPSVDHGLKTLVPAVLAAAALFVASGPMITSGDAGSISTGLFIATGVSVFMGACYAARLSAPFSPSPKEIPALGLVVAFAGFFSFSQNLVVDGFVTLPSLPHVDLPSLPSISLPF
ncbi:unnamed protein product [Pseudo-nitzschia multistriata]|uniref:Uncharacterized protein n=1 Tax=Pseudo-nitzschia multistriata TaxID=183589 RepID=A0A448Z2I2_9STRA|nr:unnamed protein product [Pseudo-nitzschia multistriata]